MYAVAERYSWKPSSPRNAPAARWAVCAQLFRPSQCFVKADATWIIRAAEMMFWLLASEDGCLSLELRPMGLLSGERERCCWPGAGPLCWGTTPYVGFFAVGLLFPLPSPSMSSQDVDIETKPWPCAGRGWDGKIGIRTPKRLPLYGRDMLTA